MNLYMFLENAGTRSFCNYLLSKPASVRGLSSAIAGEFAKDEILETAYKKRELYTEQFLKSNPSLLGRHS